jgi:hypothetical protein
MGGSATILYGREWPTVVKWRFVKDTGKHNSKGKREGGRRKGRYERTVAYSKDDAAMNPPRGPQHCSRGTLRR